MTMGGSGDPLIDALDENSAVLKGHSEASERLAAALKSANLPGVQAAIETGLKIGLLLGLGDAPAAIKTAADKTTTAAASLTTALEAMQARRPMTYAKMAGVVAVAMLVALAAGWFAGTQHMGDQVAAATASVRAEMAQATAWAGTPIGRRAQAFDKLGGLTVVLDCAGKGWERGKDTSGRDACFPGKDLGGWYLD